MSTVTVRLLSDEQRRRAGGGATVSGACCPGERLKEWKRLARAGDDESIAILADALAEAVGWYDDVSHRHGVAMDY